MVEAATSFRKNSFNDNDSATLAKVATTFQNISDEAISASESADFIIAQMKAFNIEAGDAEHIIDAVNAVSNNYAVSSGQLAKNLGNMSAALSVGNNSFEESLGLLTAGTEVTRNASKVSRALVSIQSRLNQVIDESSSTGQALTDWYKKHNIAILDQQGQLRSLYDVLTDVAEIWPTLTKNEQAYYLNQEAGANQSQNLAAILSNFDTAAKATRTALNSAGSAMRENEVVQESLEYQTQELKAEFQDLANNVIDKQLITSVLGLGEAFLKLANTGVGQLVTKIVLLAGTAWGLSSLLKVSKLLPIIIAQFANFGSVLTGIGNPAVESAIGGIGARIASLGGFSAIALPSLLAVSAAIVGIVEAAKYFSTIDERKLESLSSSLQETQDKISEMTATGSEYDMLIQNAGKLTDVERTRLGVLQAQLDTLKAQEVEQENAYLAEWQRQQTKTRTDVNVEQRTRDDGSVYYATTGTTEYTEAGRESDKLFEAVYQLNREKQLTKTTDAEYLAGLQNILDAHKETYDNLVKLREEYAKTGDETIKLSSEQEFFLQIYEHQSEVVGQLGNQYANMSNDIGAFGDAAEESASKLDTYISALDQYRGANNEAADASGVLVNSLFDANGQLTEAAKQALSTSGSMASMAQSFIQAQQAQAQADFSALILAIQEVGNAAMITTSQLASMMAMAGVSTASDLVGGRAAGTTSDMEGLRQAYFRTFGKSADADTAGFNKWVTSQIQSAGQSNYQKKMEEYKKQLESIKSYVPSGGGGSGGGSSSTKKDQAEVKAQTINTIEELREYLTDESTRLKLIDPDISKSDLQSTLSEVATIYQSYQDYLSQLKQQGFDETSEQYQQAEAEFAQFVEVLKTLFTQLVSGGKYSVDELVGYIEKNCGNLSTTISEMLGGLKTKVQSTMASISASTHQAFASGDANSIIGSIENAWDMIRSMGSSIDESYSSVLDEILGKAGQESEVAQEVADKYEWQNKLLEDKIELEEKLEALEKAKQRRMLVYSEGRFQYMQDADTISSAQADYQETYRGIEQSQIQDILGMIGEESSSFFTEYFTEAKEKGYGDIPDASIQNYPNALKNHLMKFVQSKAAGSVLENMSDEQVEKIFGAAMKPGSAYAQMVEALKAKNEAVEEAAERKAELKKQIQEENVKYYGVQTDFGEKILNAKSQEEVAYWTKLRDTKQQMIKEYREAYGDEAASKYFGTDVSKQDTWASNRDLYKEAYESGSEAWRTKKTEFERQHYFDKKDKYTESNPDLTVAQYNAATAVDMEGLGEQRLYDKIFRGSITKSEIQELYNKSKSDISKGYLLNLASEMHKAGYQGYARGTRSANSGLSVVGENGPELRVLNQGDGILPNSITDNLWRWGSMTPSDMLLSLAQKAQSWAQTLNISNVTLPNVRDAQSFVSGLRELAQQYVTRRS